MTSKFMSEKSILVAAEIAECVVEIERLRERILFEMMESEKPNLLELFQQRDALVYEREILARSELPGIVN